MLQVYRRLPVVFDRGHGVRLTSDSGRSYLDFVSGIGVASHVLLDYMLKRNGVDPKDVKVIAVGLSTMPPALEGGSSRTSKRDPSRSRNRGSSNPCKPCTTR